MFRVARKAVYLGCGIGIGLQTSVYFSDFKAFYSKVEPQIREYQSHNFIAEAAEKVLPCVVNIKVENEDRINTAGSGMFISGDLILTNAHVMGSSDNCVVTCHDGTVSKGNLYSIDTMSDLAIVKLERPTKFPTVEFGSPSKIGEWVCSIGCPFGLQNTVTAGVISSISRESKEIGTSDQRVSYIQTDCAIHPGSSGGPLVNLAGNVIGINTTKAEGDGIGFAIRIDKAMNMIRQLIQNRRITRPYLGLQTTALNQNVWKQLPALQKHSIPPVERGVLVTKVAENSPAEKAGILVGDVITQVVGEKVSNTRELLSNIGLVANQRVEILVRRNVPLEMDWDGRVNRYEIVELKTDIIPDLFNALEHS